jgi:hypothetical protein
MPSAQDANGQVLETPFGETLVLEADWPDPAEAGEAPPAAASPFINEFYAADAAAEEDADPRAAEVVELLAELHDPEFDEALLELAEDAAAAYAEQAQYGQYEDTGTATPAAERFLREYLAPVEMEAQALLERAADAAEAQDPSSMTEQELDGFLAQFDVAQDGSTGLKPEFEEFLGGLGKKLMNVVKKGVEVVGRFMPISMILRKLASLPFVRALINKVLGFALGQLPEALRPAARQLATRLLGKVGVQTQEQEGGYGPAGQPAAPPVRQIQEEFDLGVATLLLAENELEADVALAGMGTETERGEGDTPGELHLARERFIAEVTALEPGEDATAATQQFIPALLPVLRLGLRLARPAIVNALSSHVGRMIRPYVGQQSKPLARAIVDAGLRMLSLEVSEDTETRVAGAALAGTVEDTVRQLAELDETVLGNQPLLEAAIAEAFDAAAAANFPPQLIRPELRETGELHGTWVLMPPVGRPLYKAYTRIPSVRITPQLARAVRSFGGATLDTVLRDRYGTTGPVDARLRLYQAIPGTWLARVGALEQETAGVDTFELHPLTPEAAGLLLQEPGLGREVGQEYLASPDTIADGQRFYHLEIPGARAAVRTAGQVRAGGVRAGRQRRLRRLTGLSIRVMPALDRVVVRLYLSEADAQALAAKLGPGPGQDPGDGHQLTRLLLRRINLGLRAALSGRAPGRVRIVHPAVPRDHRTGQAAQRRPRVRAWLATWLPAAMHTAVTDRFAQRYGRQFADAVADAADGVTIKAIFTRPAGLGQLGLALRGQPVPAPPVPASAAPPETRVEILAGYRR